jgi:hypothetical protein
MPPYKTGCKGKKGNKGCVEDKTLLSHALGHYVGLAHTYGALDCGKVKRENGDADAQTMPMNSVRIVKDTPADPGVRCLSATQIKNRGRVVTLKMGEKFEPPWHNLMSAYTQTRSRLSPEQSAIVVEVLKNQAWRNKLEED